MASRLSRHLKPALALLASAGAAALLVPAGAVAAPSPGNPPTVASAEQRLGELAAQNSQLVEQFDRAQQDVATRQAQAVKAQQLAAAAAAQYQAARAQLGATVAAQYEGGSFSATGALLSSNSGQSYLDQLDTLTMLSTHTSQVVDAMKASKKVADSTSKNADVLLSSARAKRDALARQRQQVQTQVNKYTALLATLTSAQRAAYQRMQNPSVSAQTISNAKVQLSAMPATSAAAAKAVRFALEQVGKPYVFGAAGPGSFDCSGLTMAAWASAGVSLPHSAEGQYSYGHHVAFNQLQPGDLMFFYQPIGHVTIYVGGGLMVSAPTEGENVSVVPANAFGGSFTGATRLTH